MNSNTDFVACDMPHASRLVLHVMAAFAEHERQIIGERTKAALAAAKARGVLLGANGLVLAERHKSQARGPHRRPGAGRGPYRVIYRLGDVADAILSQ